LQLEIQLLTLCINCFIREMVEELALI